MKFEIFALLSAALLNQVTAVEKAYCIVKGEVMPTLDAKNMSVLGTTKFA